MHTRKSKLRTTLSNKFKIGSLLTMCASVMLLGVLVRGAGMNIDYPCEMGLGPSPSATPGVRVTYCLSWWPRDAASGGGIAAWGKSEGDSLLIRPTGAFGNPLTVERIGQTLVVNGRMLQPSEMYSQSYWFPSLNLWQILTSEITVTNRGAVKIPVDGGQVADSDTLYLSGDVREGRAFSPAGLICLIIGVGLMLGGIRERRTDRLLRAK